MTKMAEHGPGLPLGCGTVTGEGGSGWEGGSGGVLWAASGLVLTLTRPPRQA